MKTKLMFAALAAAAVFTACNKEPNPVQNDQIGTRSISINIANVLPATKGDGTTIKHTDKVQLNSYEVFFVGGNTLYTPKDLTAQNDADTYFDNKTTEGTGEAAKLEVATLTRQFHFLPKAVSEVIVVGNMPKVPATITTKSDLLTHIQNLTITGQQSPDNLRLVGIDTQLSKYTNNPPTHETQGEDEHPNPILQAQVTLKPAVARFEITGFEYAQVPEMTEKKDADGNIVYVKDADGNNTTTPEMVPTGNLLPREYSKMAVNNVSMINYQPAATFAFDGTVTPSGTAYYAGSVFTNDDIYAEYFKDVDRTLFSFDDLDNKTTDEVEAIALDTQATPYVYGVNDTDGTLAAGAQCYYYHTFPRLVPSFVVGLTGAYKDAANNEIVTPLYIQTQRLVANNEVLEETVAGNIYRMYFKFDDNDLTAAEKCIQVEVSVLPWTVVITTPEFGGATAGDAE